MAAQPACTFSARMPRRPSCKASCSFAGKHRQQGMARGSRETCLLPHAPAILTQSAPWQPSGPPWGVFRIFCIRSKKQRAKLYCTAGNGGTRRGRGDSPPPASGISGLIAAAEPCFIKQRLHSKEYLPAACGHFILQDRRRLPSVQGLTPLHIQYSETSPPGGSTGPESRVICSTKRPLEAGRFRGLKAG